ncbi:MAG: hypothetical protein ACT4PX_08755 [Actinomycetota bacterium]
MDDSLNLLPSRGLEVDMVIEEGARHRLYSHLQELLGEDDVETLMGYLPPTGWADVATKRDLDQLAQVIRAEMAAHEARVEARMDTRLATLEARMDTGLSSLEARMDTGMSTLEARMETGLSSLEARMDKGLSSLAARTEAGQARASLDARSSLRTLFLGLVGLQMSGAALAVAVARAG